MSDRIERHTEVQGAANDRRAPYQPPILVLQRINRQARRLGPRRNRDVDPRAVRLGINLVFYVWSSTGHELGRGQVDKVNAKSWRVATIYRLCAYMHMHDSWEAETVLV